VPQQGTTTHEFIRERWTPKEPTGPGVEATPPDRRGLLGAGNQLTHAVRNGTDAGKKQFGESLVIAVSCGHSHNLPLDFSFY
jgi:hypothetical protein